MLYVEFEEYKNKYYASQKEYDKILSEKEALFLRTQPKATTYDKERISGGTPINSFEEYIESIEEKQIDARLDVARSILKDRERLLKLKEVELRNSKDWLDIIYVYYFIEKWTMRKIAKKIYCSPTEVYRKIEIIRKNAKLEQKVTKHIV